MFLAKPLPLEERFFSTLVTSHLGITKVAKKENRVLFMHPYQWACENQK